MHDDEETGSAEQAGWQPPEYVSPWLPASSSSGDDTEGSGDTISFGGGPVYDASQGQPGGHDPGPGQARGGGQGPVGAPGYPAGPGYGAPGYPASPGYGAAPGYGPGYGQGQAAPGYGAGNAFGAGPTGPGYPGGGGYGGGPGYGPPGYGQDPWGGYGAPPPPPRSGFSRTLAYLAVAVIAAGAGAGAAVALNHTSTNPAAIAPSGGSGGGTGNGPTGNGGTGNSGNGGLGNGLGGVPSNGNSGTGNSGTGGTNSGTGSLNTTALANKVDPGLVDVISDLKYSGATAEGTGMVLTSSGLVLTNNHVIDEATQVSATLVESGKTYTARVIGYDSTDDVALLQLVGASGLKTVNVGDSTKVKVAEAVLALGNAGGRGGLPSTAQGTIQGLNKSIQASDEGAGTTENLHGMIETNAPIEEGDSGGPLVNGSGQVVGMDTAANTGEGAGGQGGEGGAGTTATQGFAIPINKAVTIADEIADGKASTNVHIGLAGFMGVNVADANDPANCGTGTGTGGDGFGGLGGITPAVNSGALVCDVYPGAPAATAGLTGGDVITSVNGTKVSSADGLTNEMSSSKPGSQLSIVYVNENGARHTTTVTLTEWAR
jgi:S1-C subfamily serine protease